MPDRIPKFRPIVVNDRIFQGEIFVGLIQSRQKLETIGQTEGRELTEIIHPFSVVVTQDCDLESDFRLRSNGGSGPALLPNVLFCEAIETVALQENHKRTAKSSTAWTQITQNKNERYQCFERVPSEHDAKSEGLPSIACDFKRYFSLSADEVYKRIELQQITRRCCLATPYAEHFLSRFSYFQSRFALPEEHDVALK